MNEGFLSIVLPNWGQIKTSLLLRKMIANSSNSKKTSDGSSSLGRGKIVKYGLKGYVATYESHS